MDANASRETTAESSDKDGAASQAVKVALHIRPLIAQERIQGCKECVQVVPGQPQVQIGAHAFTFDHVYGSCASPPLTIFDDCVKSLVEGLFHGYNATVLAYGQTGSGKTYTMGTAYTVGGSTQGIIPLVMDTIFRTVESLKDKADFQLRVSFIEILKEEVHDLLDPNPPSTMKPDMANAAAVKNLVPGKPPIQIRETGNGGIMLAGVTETEVRSLSEMAACLEHGSLCRATGSTNMNTQSSRSHAIFTITVEQRRKWDAYLNGDTPIPEDTTEDFLCAKLHLVDLAGSERAKRTKADGNRFKEGVHINKGLLALGNVISALGDDKKRKEGGHVPYRDSKLTRLLQDSLGGNSRTVMIACVSPADSNAEETLNTLKYANRARNIHNKPIVNRDPMAAEMQRMRQQLEILQAELLCARATSIPEEMEILKQKVAWLEASNLDLRHELHQSASSSSALSQQLLEIQVERDKLQLKLQKLRSGDVEENDSQDEDLLRSYLSKIQELETELQRTKSSRPHFTDLVRNPVHCLENNTADLSGMVDLPGDNPVEGDEDVVAAKELEHTMLQDCLDKELQELNKRLELKEAEMKTFVRPDNFVLKQHFEKKLVELEEEKKSLQKERDILLKELDDLATNSDEHAHKMQETYVQKLKNLEHQIADLKKKQENQAQLLRQKQRSDEAAKRLQDDIQRIKQQKVQLQNKIKQESEQFRAWKSAREKEVLQLRKEGRRNEFEMHKLQALHQRQKLVLQRKTEEAALATRRLKELLEARKVSSRENVHGPTLQNNDKALQQWLDQELEVVVRVHEVRAAYEKQTEARSTLAKELAKLNDEEQAYATPNTTQQRMSSTMSPSARRARIGLLEIMLDASSNTLVAMASQLSEAEERERAFTGRARWQNLRTIGDLRSMLNLCFDAAAFARCQLRDKEIESKDLREKITELSQTLKESEEHRMEVEKQQRLKEQAVAVALATASKAGTDAAVKRGVEELTLGLRQLAGTAKRVQYHDGDNSGIPYDLRKVSRVSTYDGSDSSEWEIDMELDGDLSDKDWEEEDEKYTVRNKKNWKKSSILGRKSSFAGSNDEAPRDSSEQSFETDAADDTSCEDGDPNKLTKPGSDCCSCRHTSGCKTKKCECRQAGGLCGINCSCKSGKCSNRELSTSLAEDAQAGSSTTGEARAAAEALAKQGAELLGRAFMETARKTDGEPKLRQPLSDIGNKVVMSVPKPVKQRRKSKMVETRQDAPAAAPTSEAVEAVQTAEAGESRERRQQQQQQQPPLPPVSRTSSRGSTQSASASSSPRTSPLRARNRHQRESTTTSKRPAQGSTSPSKKAGDEKENLR